MSTRTLAELAIELGGTVLGDDSLMIRGVAGIREAQPGDVTFLANSRYEGYLAETRATAGIWDRQPRPAPVPLLQVDHPYLAFQKAVRRFRPELYQPLPGVHPTAVVSPAAHVGAGASIGPHCTVEPGARIGEVALVAGVGEERDVTGLGLADPGHAADHERIVPEDRAPELDRELGQRAGAHASSLAWLVLRPAGRVRVQLGQYVVGHVEALVGVDDNPAGRVEHQLEPFLARELLDRAADDLDDLVGGARVLLRRAAVRTPHVLHERLVLADRTLQRGVLLLTLERGQHRALVPHLGLELVHRLFLLGGLVAPALHLSLEALLGLLRVLVLRPDARGVDVAHADVGAGRRGAAGEGRHDAHPRQPGAR